jgi:hypothetical protein
MAAHRPASTDPVTAPAPATAGSLRAPRWDKTVHTPITACCPPLPRRPPSCPTVGALAQGGDGCSAPFPRVAVRPFRTPFRDRRQEMCGQMRHTILANRRFIGRPSGGFILKSAAGGPGNASSPHQFPPLWKPPFPDPPSKLESTKGGETAGGTGTAASMARLKKPRGPSPPAEPCAAALRVPGPLRRLSPVAPRPPGGQARWSGRGGLVPHTSPTLQGINSPMFSGSSLSPPCAFSPPRGRARWFCGGAPASRGRAPAKQCRGDPGPPWEPRVLSGGRQSPRPA